MVAYDLWGDAESLDMQRAIACMKYVGIYQRKTDFYKQRQPAKYEGPYQGRPRLEDNDRKIKVFNGRPIALHVLLAEGMDLVPRPWHYDRDTYTTKAAAFDNACGTERYDFDPIATGLLKEARAKAEGKDHNAEHYAELQNDMKLLLTSYDDTLGKQTYLVGDDCMAVDLFHLPLIRALDQFPDAVPALSDLPNAARWWKKLAGLPFKLDSSKD